MELLLEKFSEFVSEFKQKPEHVQINHKLGSFIIPIDKFDPVGIIDRITNNCERFFYWRIPERGYSVLGLGNLFNFRINGPDRIKETESLIDDISRKIYTNKNIYNIKDFPLVMGGLKFSHKSGGDKWNDFSDSDWIIPEYILLSVSNSYYLIFNFKIFDIDQSQNRLAEILNSVGRSDYSPVSVYKTRIKIKNNRCKDEALWKDGVQVALEQISKGQYQKVVLSRVTEADITAKPDIQNIIAELSDKYPKCYIFAYKSGPSVFFGASPEKLIRISDNIVEADALAGSIARGIDTEEDKKLETELLNSEKNLAEQKAVVDFIAHSFEGFAENIEFNNSPVIRKLDNIQHLWTPVKAKLKNGISILSVLKDIHPTPAICGTPCSIASEAINKLENYPRGMYAGVIGWFNFNCEGEFAVGIRTGLIKDEKLYAFAGCGIIEGSDPKQEYEEAELKMIPILSLFENEN